MSNYAWASDAPFTTTNLTVDSTSGGPNPTTADYGGICIYGGGTATVGWLIAALAEKIQQNSTILSDLFEVQNFDTISGLTGHGNLNYNYSYGCDVEVTMYGSDLDAWWASSDIRKYGVIRATYGDWAGELQFINSLKSRLFFPGGMCTGLVYNLFPGVTANITPFYRSAIPHISGINNGSASKTIDWGAT